MEQFFLVYLISLPSLTLFCCFNANLKSVKPYLIPVILKDEGHSRDKYRKTATAYILWVIWLVSADIYIFYKLQDYFKTTEMNLASLLIQGFFFTSFFVSIIFFIISVYYYYETLFMTKEKSRPKLESITFFNNNLVHVYAGKLKLYLLINLSVSAAFVFLNYLGLFEGGYLVLINAFFVIVFLITLGRLRAYELKLAGCLGADPKKLLVSTPGRFNNVYLHSIKLLKMYKENNKNI